MNGPAIQLRFGFWKSALYSATICVILLAGMELVLRAAGVRTAIEREDPSQGFSGLVSVFVRDGALYRTRTFERASPFNDQSFLARKPENGFRIFTLGGSSAFGHPWGARVAFTALLGEAVAAAHPHRRVEAVNAAGVSYSIHRLGLVSNEILHYEPDALVLFSGHNEFAEPTFYSEVMDRGPARSRLLYLASHSRIYSIMHAAFARRHAPERSAEARFDMSVRRSASHTYGSKKKEEAAERFRDELRRIVRAAHAQGVRVLLATVPANLRGWRPGHSIVDAPLDEGLRASWASALASGKRRLEAGAFDEAALDLHRALALAPDFAETSYELGRAYEGLGRWDQARRYYTRACDLDASPVRRTTAINAAVAGVALEEGALLVDADSLFASRSPNGLVGFDLIDDFVHPTREGHRLIAWHIWDAMEQAGWLGTPGRANPAIFDRIARGPHGEPDAREPAWLYNQGYTLAHQGQARLAIAKFREALEIAPTFEPALANLARLLADEGENEQAEKAAADLLRQYPENVRGRVLMGMLLGRRGREEDAIAEFRRAIRAAPDDAPAYLSLGGLLLKRQRLKEARSAFARALEIDPGALDARLGLARAAASSGDGVEAVRQYRAAVEAHPASVAAHEELGLLLSSSGQVEEGVRMLEIAAALSPGSGPLLVALGTAYFRAGHLDGAADQFREAVRIEPDNGEAHAGLGRLLARAGETKAAIQHYREAIRSRPDWPPPYNNLAWILATDPDDGLRDPAEALALADRALALSAQPNATYLDTRAAALAAAGRFTEATSAASKALQIAANHADRSLALEIRKRMAVYARGEAPGARGDGTP